MLKNDYGEGGLNITDVECLNRSLKLRQFIRANGSCHPISRIQKFCLEKLGYKEVIMQEYSKITTREAVTKLAQTTINSICDYMRLKVSDNRDDAMEISSIIWVL